MVLNRNTKEKNKKTWKVGIKKPCQIQNGEANNSESILTHMKTWKKVFFIIKRLIDLKYKLVGWFYGMSTLVGLFNVKISLVFCNYHFKLFLIQIISIQLYGFKYFYLISIVFIQIYLTYRWVFNK